MRRIGYQYGAGTAGMFEIFHEVPVKCSARKLYGAITAENAISNWWLKGSRYEARVGAVNSFPLSDGSGQIRMKVLELIEGKSQKWLCVEHKHIDWINTEVSFEVVPESADTSVLRFKHSNWRERSGVFGRVSFYWSALYLRNLRDMLEAGKL
ncbi:MAG TPA: SRPBCC domain-containing protein [Patescibacteria group bacterium]|nr:SRPBCC domain-containing protein [Patescibacteria group bacterium]